MRLTVQLSGICFVILSAATVFAAEIEHANDWPQFHGPRRDNISRETGLLKDWPKEGPALVWKINGIGRGYSSVAVAAGRIFTAGDAEDGSYVIALKESDGQQLWKSKVGATGRDYPGTRSTPTVDGERLYMLGQFGDLVCLKVDDGAEVWRASLKKDLRGEMMSGWGNAESIVIAGDKVICSPGGKQGTLAALDKTSGKVVWRSKELTDASTYTAPVIAAIGGIEQAVVLTNESVAGIDIADGKLLWRHKRHGETAVIPTPVVKDNLVYVTSGYDVGCDLFKITAADGHFTAENVYSNQEMVNHHGGVILVGDYLYGYSDHGGWKCQELSTGKVKWTDNNKTLGKGTLSYADGLFYLRGEGSGAIVLAEMTPEKITVKSRFKQPGRSGDAAWSHLVIANGRLYVRDQDLLLCYDVKGK